jgi:hypothetical protein
MERTRNRGRESKFHMCREVEFISRQSHTCGRPSHCCQSREHGLNSFPWGVEAIRPVPHFAISKDSVFVAVNDLQF